MIHTSMKKNIYFVTLLCTLIITFHTRTYGQQCDSPSICTQVTFIPAPTSQLPMPEFDLDCNDNSIEATLGIGGANNITYNWYNSNGVSTIGMLTTPAPGSYILEVEYTIGVNSFCCSQEIVVNDWGLDVDMEVRRQGEVTPITEVCLGENVVLVSAGSILFHYKCKIATAVSALRPPLLLSTPYLLWHLPRILIHYVRVKPSP